MIQTVILILFASILNSSYGFQWAIHCRYYSNCLEVCTFPFTYQGEVHNDCTLANSQQFWCAWDSNYVSGSGRWSYCTGYDMKQSSASPMKIHVASLFIVGLLILIAVNLICICLWCKNAYKNKAKSDKIHKNHTQIEMVTDIQE